MIKTFSPKASQITREWRVLDAAGQTLGRLASHAAVYLRGKHKPTYAPHMDMGDHVVIVNAEKIKVTGQKLQQKVYHWHSGYPGGLKSRTLEQQLAKFPTRVVESAVRGMLPDTALGVRMFRKLHVYAGPDHPHQGQLVARAKPAVASVDGRRPRRTTQRAEAAEAKTANAAKAPRVSKATRATTASRAKARPSASRRSKSTKEQAE